MLDSIFSIFLENPLWQSVWIIAMIVMTYSWSIKNDKKMLYWFTASLAIWSIHFFLLGLITASSLYLFMFVRNILFFKWPKNKWLFILAAIIPIIILLQTYENHTDIVITIAPLIFIYWIYFQKWINLRICLILISFIWLYYSFVVQSFGWIITEIIYLAWILIGIYKIKKSDSSSKKILQ